MSPGGTRKKVRMIYHNIRFLGLDMYLQDYADSCATAYEKRQVRNFSHRFILITICLGCGTLASPSLLQPALAGLPFPSP